MLHPWIMQVPIQVTFRGIPQSDAIDSYIRMRAAKLERLSARISHCRVAIEAKNHHSRALHFRVRVDLTVPRAELVVDGGADQSTDSTDAYAAIDRAFDQMGRRLQDHVRRQRGDVKSHEPG